MVRLTSLKEVPVTTAIDDPLIAAMAI
ncbi:MAG: hypothetical protein QOI79_1477, partial [Mycobacterium sp.]|nr:hypothetical protein [Mycobacterium sp.]